MKRVIASSQPQTAMLDIIESLQLIMKRCGEMEDYYFGEDVTSNFTKIHNFAEKALTVADKTADKLG